MDCKLPDLSPALGGVGKSAEAHKRVEVEDCAGMDGDKRESIEGGELAALDGDAK